METKGYSQSTNQELFASEAAAVSAEKKKMIPITSKANPHHILRFVASLIIVSPFADGLALHGVRFRDSS